MNHRSIRVLTLVMIAFIGATILSIFSPFSGYYADNYLWGISNNRKILERTASASKRIILFGGSSLAWSVSAKDLSEHLGIDTINLGVHAGIGYKKIFEIYSDLLHPERDILVVSPEYGLIQNNNMLTETYCDWTYLSSEISVNKLLCSPISVMHVVKDLFYSFLRKTVSIDDDYHKRGFNSFGDYELHHDRPNQKFFAREDMVAAILREDNLIDEYRSYLSSLKKLGFAILYVPTIIPKTACASINADLYNLNMRISKDTPSFYDKSYPFCANDELFYNTIYHMNLDGNHLKTSLFEKAIKSFLTNKLFK